MEMKNLQRREPKKVSMTIRVTEKVSKWLKEKNISPTALFNEAVKEITKTK